MESEKVTATRPLLLVGRLVSRVVGVLAQTFVLFLAIPALIIKGVAHVDLPEWTTTTLTAIGFFAYLYALIRWLLHVADRLGGPTARARYRRKH